ncbi:MAG: SurA N-terminal domain-containing protein [Anaerolineae bacterium]|jgi:parvulin-like peptidyl-prolyl isomerase
MKTKLNPGALRGFKIAAIVLVILLGLLPLPLLALPYDFLDWIVYDPAYKEGYCYPPPPPAAPPGGQAPDPSLPPCAEIPAPGAPLAARVNSQGIGLEAYERELGQFLRGLEAIGADPQSPEFQAALPTYRRQVLDLMIEDVLVQQAGQNYGIAVTGAEIKERVNTEVLQGGGLDLFQAWLAETGQSWDEFRREVCQDILRRRLQAHVTAEITGTLEMVHARQIVVPTQEQSVDVLTRLASGQAFDAVAAEISIDPLTRERGGDLGWLPRGPGWISPQAEAAAFSATPGQVQEPVPAGDAYVILQVLEYNAELQLDAPALETVRANVFDRWLANQRRGARIEVYIEF